jgi:prepilin-type N-terminal cleavage/methylation domain-containing protein
MNVRINKKEKGFTILELLVVIAIIAILSGVVMAALSPAREKSRDARRQTDIKQIQLALEVYFQANNQFPTNIYTLGVLAPNYIQKVPVDPSTGAQYSYGYNNGTSPTDFHLGAVMENPANKPATEANRHTGTTGENWAAATPVAGWGFNGTDNPDPNPANHDCFGNIGSDWCYDVSS